MPRQPFQPKPLGMRINMSTEISLACEKLTKTFKLGDQTLNVINELDLSVKRGERISIVGASGSGKTTMLNLLAGLDRATQGKVIIAGQSLANMSEKQVTQWRNKNMGFVFQSNHLLSEFTALENVLMPISIRGKVNKEAKDKAKNLLAQVGLKERIAHKPGELSGGERQRVAIARAVINDPKVVLMDEPTGNLDEKSAEQIHQLILDLNQSIDATFIIVTHNKDFALSMPKCLQLSGGKLSQIN